MRVRPPRGTDIAVMDAAVTTTPPSRQRRLRMVTWLLLGTVACVSGLAGTQYAAWAGDPGPAGCVARAYRLFSSSERVDACMLQRLDALVDERGVAGGLAEIERQAATNPLLKLRCHLPMHMVGQRQLREGLTPRSLGSVAAQGDLTGVCTKGFVHGYMQALSEQHAGSATAFVELARGLCTTMRQADRAVCVHGAGHGVARATGNALPEASRHCALLADRVDERNCVKGAVMELQLADRALAARMRADRGIRRPADVDCRQVAAAHRTACRQRKLGGTALEFVFRSGTV